MDRTRLANASGRQKRQARMLRSRLETQGTPKTEAKERAAIQVRSRMKNGGTRVVSKGEETVAKDRLKTLAAKQREDVAKSKVTTVLSIRRRK